MTTPIWLRATYKWVDVGAAIGLLVLGAVVLRESIELGPGWGASGPDAGFFPFWLTVLMLIGTLGVIWYAFRKPDERPFFEVNQEVTDLLRVGVPIAAATTLIPWAGMYVTAGLYLGFFMFWYGNFRWYWSLAGAILLPAVLWIMLREGFNISMPMSMFYRTNVLPF